MERYSCKKIRIEVGDLVELRKDLEDGKKYGGVFYFKKMQPEGKITEPSNGQVTVFYEDWRIRGEFIDKINHRKVFHIMNDCFLEITLEEGDLNEN